MPYTQSYTVGWQRKLAQDSAFEVRYVGSRHRQDWETVQHQRGQHHRQRLPQEFRKAQANLQANIAAGRGATFAYTGAPGTSPLPTFLAFFNGLPSAQAGNAASYTSTQLDQRDLPRLPRGAEPEPVRLRVDERDQRLRRQRDVPHQRRRAGLPANFFLANPDVLGGTPTTRRRQPDDQLRRHARELDSGRVPQAAVERPDRSTPATPGRRVHDAALRLPARRSRRSRRPARSATCSTPSRATGSTSCRSARASAGAATRAASSTRCSAAGRSTASAASRPARARLRQRAPGRHDARTSSSKSVELRVGAGGQIFILPEDIIDNTVKAFRRARRRRTATARSARRPAATSRRPTGRTASRPRRAPATAASAAWW